MVATTFGVDLEPFRFQLLTNQFAEFSIVVDAEEFFPHRALAPHGFIRL